MDRHIKVRRIATGNPPEVQLENALNEEAKKGYELVAFDRNMNEYVLVLRNMNIEPA